MRGTMILAGLASAALAACNTGGRADDEEREGRSGGPKIARTFNVAAFDSVSLGGPHNVIVTVGGAHSVRAEGPQYDLDKLEIKIEDSTLEIGSKREKKRGFSFGHDGKAITVHVTVPALKAASIGGSGDIVIDKVEGESFAAAIGGSGDIEVKTMRVGEADFSIGGNGSIVAAGTAQRSKISIGGSGDVSAENLESRATRISIAGSGEVRAKAMDTADVTIVGSGDVEISGTAKCEVSKMGSGDIRCPG